MADLHVTFDLLAAADEGRITRQELVDLLARHLFSLCPTCSAEHDAFRDQRGPDQEEPALPEEEEPALPEETAAFSPEEYDRVILATAKRTSDIQESVRREERRAPAELRLLLSLRLEEALGRIERARTRYRSAALANALLAETRSSLPERPRRALILAELAAAVARRLLAGGREVPVYRAECRALALAHQANALRALDDLRGADEHFARARQEADRGGVTDPVVLAELDALEGSLRRAQRRFEDSETLLRRGLALAVVAEDLHALTRILVTLGSLYHHWGRPEEALDCVGAALSVMPDDAPERLRLCAVHNHLFYLCEAGRFDLAAPLLEEARSAYGGFEDSWTANRLRWVEAKIALGQGAFDRAVELLAAARTGFVEANALYDAALASLELAALYLETGRAAACQRVAGDAVALFTTLEISREAAAALAQVQAALARQTTDVLTVALLRGAARTFEISRRD